MRLAIILLIFLFGTACGPKYSTTKEKEKYIYNKALNPDPSAPERAFTEVRYQECKQKCDDWLGRYNLQLMAGAIHTDCVFDCVLCRRRIKSDSDPDGCWYNRTILNPSMESELNRYGRCGPTRVNRDRQIINDCY